MNDAEELEFYNQYLAGVVKERLNWAFMMPHLAPAVIQMSWTLPGKCMEPDEVKASAKKPCDEAIYHRCTGKPHVAVAVGALFGQVPEPKGAS